MPVIAPSGDSEGRLRQEAKRLREFSLVTFDMQDVAKFAARHYGREIAHGGPELLLAPKPSGTPARRQASTAL